MRVCHGRSITLVNRFGKISSLTHVLDSLRVADDPLVTADSGIVDVMAILRQTPSNVSVVIASAVNRAKI